MRERRVCELVYECVCVFVCVLERERESERDIGRRGCEGDFLISAKEDLDFFSTG